MKHKNEIIELGALIQALMITECHEEEEFFRERMEEKLTDLAVNWHGTTGDCVLFANYIGSWYYELNHLFDGVTIEGEVVDAGIPHLREMYDEVCSRLSERIR